MGSSDEWDTLGQMLDFEKLNKLSLLRSEIDLRRLCRHRGLYQIPYITFFYQMIVQATINTLKMKFIEYIGFILS